MEIKKHYCEVMDIVDKLFVTMFDSLNASCKKELEAIGRQYPFEPLKYLRKTLWLTFKKMFKCSRCWKHSTSLCCLWWKCAVLSDNLCFVEE
ncbi:aspartate--tRNA ligase 2, cytoplasmic-like isoform X2 [Syzygium oleosum]|uniref:aspartate--tRNA ligase 2, cytoplasmic-like isoform X2 n=1 Tax=Syzygium oleosum TaxID=219896 RepID=UPI0024B88EB1|nr:aspartate--tRNA ligase 2, cytoplasmic-like isoform X2 [Syzygium oleosum]